LTITPKLAINQTHEKQNMSREKCKNISELLGGLKPESQQLIEGAIEKGASSWLSALPIKAIRYARNKHEFKDADLHEI